MRASVIATPRTLPSSGRNAPTDRRVILKACFTESSFYPCRTLAGRQSMRRMRVSTRWNAISPVSMGARRVYVNTFGRKGGGPCGIRTHDPLLKREVQRVDSLSILKDPLTPVLCPSQADEVQG